MDQTGYLISLADRAEQNDAEAKALLASWDKDNNPLKALHRDLRGNSAYGASPKSCSAG
jgi:hypothetical protein